MQVYATRILTDVYGRTVRLSDERVQHILTNHPDLVTRFTGLRRHWCILT